MPPDLINRGSKEASPWGSFLFVLLRTLDIPLQHAFLARNLGDPILRSFGANIRPPGPAVHHVGLSLHRSIILGMAVGSTAKQLYWLLGISEEEFPPSASIPVSIYNTLFNSVNTLLFLASTGNADEGSTPKVLFGTGLYVTGLLIELVSEIQRRNFKKDPRNKGKVFTGGLFAWARHINYFGYSLWRAGYSYTTSGSWKVGLFVGAYLATDFVFRAIPVLDNYCSKRYGEQWIRYKATVRSKIIPGIW